MIAQCIVYSAHAAPRHVFVKRGVDIYQCPTCGCLMGDLQFAGEQYEKADYYTLAFQDRTEVEQEWGFRWRYLLRWIEALVPSRPRILDVGAGNGYFVYLARSELGFDAQGIEISNAEIRYAKEKFGIELRARALAEIDDEFDVVTLFNVLEHVEDPGQLLSAIRDRLRPNGYLLVTTPNPSCIHRRISGLERWGMVDPPHHINLFTRTALRELHEHKGFAVQRYETLSTYIRFVRAFDGERLLLRKVLFHILRLTNLGADHLLISRKCGP